MENDIMIRDICFQYSIHLMIIDIIIIWEYIIDEGRWFSSYPSRAIYERYKVICIHDIEEILSWVMNFMLEEIKIIVSHYVTGFRGNFIENGMHRITKFSNVTIGGSIN